MKTFIIILCSSSISTSIMLISLIFVANKEQYAVKWIYSLLKIGLVFLTVPVVVFTMLISLYLLKLNYISSNQADFEIYKKFSYFILQDTFLNNNFFYIFFIIWIFGVLISTIILIIKIIRFYFDVCKNSIQVDDVKLLQIVDKIRQGLNIKREIPVYYSNLVDVPFLMIIRSPVIVLGNMDFSYQELYFIIKHELIHLKRKHILFKRLCIIIKIMYWFNPFVYSFVRFFSEYCELDCDREVLTNENMQQRIFYSKILLKMLSKKTSFNPAIGSSFISNMKNQTIERRFLNIMNINKIKSTKRIIILSICYLLCCPATVYASTIGSIKIQSDFVKSNLIENSNDSILNFENKTNDNPNTERRNVIRLNWDTKGRNEIDDFLDENQSILITVTAKSSSIRVNFSCDSSNDQFGIGVGSDYVTSSNGMLSYTFDTEIGREYKIYIDNLSSNKIHISGYIYI